VRWFPPAAFLAALAPNTSEAVIGGGDRRKYGTIVSYDLITRPL
jgi:hypothetical protein